MIEIIDCEQGSPEWLKVRAGLPTASEFASIMATGRGGGDSKMRRSYLLRLASEIITGEPGQTFSNVHMERGKAMEQEARDLYAFTCDEDPQRVGFLKNGRKGCSPDALIGVAGMLEIKTKLPHLAIDCLLQGEVPSEHKAQCQGALWVAEREWIDFVIYWPRLPLFVRRIYRDDAYIGQLSDVVDRLTEELDLIVEHVRRLSSEKSPDAWANSVVA
jgi:hypothetical protein